MLQGFPDDFVFIGNRMDVKTQIGNAVPPPMARAAGEAILLAIEGKQAKAGSYPAQRAEAQPAFTF